MTQKLFTISDFTALWKQYPVMRIAGLDEIAAHAYSVIFDSPTLNAFNHTLSDTEINRINDLLESGKKVIDVILNKQPAHLLPDIHPNPYAPENFDLNFQAGYNTYINDQINKTKKTNILSVRLQSPADITSRRRNFENTFKTKPEIIRFAIVFFILQHIPDTINTDALKYNKYIRTIQIIESQCTPTLVNSTSGKKHQNREDRYKSAYQAFYNEATTDKFSYSELKNIAQGHLNEGDSKYPKINKLFAQYFESGKTELPDEFFNTYNR